MGERRKRPTIHDVARHARVSITTVSHTFSGNGKVAPATRDRVRAAAVAIGYQPDVLASSLRTNRLGVLALVLRSFESADAEPDGIDYVLQFAGAAAFTAMRLRYGVMLVADPSRPGAPATALACDGFIVTEPDEDDPLVRTLEGGRIPYVTVGRVPGRPAVDALEIHTESITDRVLDRVAAGGARRVALVAGTRRNAWYLDTEAAYLAWAGRRRQPPLMARVCEQSLEAGGATAVDELFAGDDPPDALYCMTSHHAVGAVARLRDRGLSVPHDVQVICGSDAVQLRAGSPSVTAVDLQPELLARQAVTRLVNKLDGTAHPEPDEAATGLIVVRGSTLPGTAADAGGA